MFGRYVRCGTWIGLSAVCKIRHNVISKNPNLKTFYMYTNAFPIIYRKMPYSKAAYNSLAAY